MNYLAHIYLSGEDPNLIIGNFIADFVKGNDYQLYPIEIQKGILLHRSIDSFTDSHIQFKKSVSRLFPKHRHYSRVIVDMFYDHFLATNWEDYSQISLEDYSADFYNLINDNFEILPGEVQRFFPYMVEHNWLVSYSDVHGLKRILSQMDRRTTYNSNMQKAVEDLINNYKAYRLEFESFMPNVIAFSQKMIQDVK